MAPPERPPYIWFNGRVRAWHEATVHVWSELAVRGASVFEGVRCYRHPDGSFHCLSLDAHLKRLFDSARILRMPAAYDTVALTRAIKDIVHAVAKDEHLYVRPTLYVDTGRYGLDLSEVTAGAYVVAVPVSRSNAVMDGVRCCVSSWQRVSDVAFPVRVKAGAAYQAFRLPMLEARDRGFDDAILLNSHNKVAEATGASVFIVRRGVVSTPPLSAGTLESITRANTIALLRSEWGIDVVERDIQRDELYVADEIFLTGTLAEILPVTNIDGIVIGHERPGELTCMVRDRYLQICDGHTDDHHNWLSLCVRGDIQGE